MTIVQTHDSSLIEKTIFDDKEETLIVFFKNGGSYEYSNFDTDDYDSFMNASSQGAYFAKNIKTLFPYRKIS